VAAAGCAAAPSSAAQPESEHNAPLRMLAAALASAWQALLARVALAVQAAKQRAAATDRETLASGISAQIRQSVRHARMLTVVAPFAAAGGSYGTTSNTLLLLTRAVASFIKVAAWSLSTCSSPVCS